MSHVLLVSDLHLAPERPAAAEAFAAFLAGPARDAGALYVLGDLFEYWIGDEDCDEPFNARVVAALRALSDARVALAVQHGNRDFLLGAEFARRAGCTLLPETHLATLGGVPTLLLHGDQLCTDDHAYQAFRAQVRDVAWQQGFLALPAPRRREMARQARAESEVAKAGKAMAIMDANPLAVSEAFRAFGCARMIHGHTHRPARHALEVDGRARERWVLPDWYEQGGALRVDERGCHPVGLAPA